MTSLRTGVALRRSYSATARSLAADASSSESAGLKRTAVTVSAPHAKLLTGSERSWSHTSTCARAQCSSESIPGKQYTYSICTQTTPPIWLQAHVFYHSWNHLLSINPEINRQWTLHELGVLRQLS